MKRILVVDGDMTVRAQIGRYARLEGYDVAEASDGYTAVALCRQSTFDFVILAVMLPELDGFSVCQTIRSFSQVPILILSERGDEADRIRGLELGADDYVVKPFNIRELLLRIRAILRRQVMVESNPVLTRHGVSVDPAAHKVTVLGQDVELTATEFRLIEDLLRNAGRVRTREELLAAVWGYQFEGYARTVDTHIRRLRNKLGDAAEIIETVRGVGYRCKE